MKLEKVDDNQLKIDAHDDGKVVQTFTREQMEEMLKNTIQHAEELLEETNRFAKEKPIDPGDGSEEQNILHWTERFLALNATLLFSQSQKPILEDIIDQCDVMGIVEKPVEEPIE